MAREHYLPLLRFATRLTANEAEARDLVQDTFERALRRQASFEDGTNERAWLHSILHNAFLDRCRRRAARRTVSDDALVEKPADPAPEPPPWASISAQELARAIDSLDSEFQTVYRMHAIDERSYKEIADALSIPMNTVGTRLSRARQKLKAALVALTGEAGGAS